MVVLSQRACSLRAWVSTAQYNTKITSMKCGVVYTHTFSGECESLTFISGRPIQACKSVCAGSKVWHGKETIQASFWRILYSIGSRRVVGGDESSLGCNRLMARNCIFGLWVWKAMKGFRKKKRRCLNGRQHRLGSRDDLSPCVFATGPKAYRICWGPAVS